LDAYLQVSLDGVTGARASVDGRVEGLLKEMKEVTFPLVFRCFCIFVLVLPRVSIRVVQRFLVLIHLIFMVSML